MKDKDGFDIRCKFSDWEIIDDRDNHDYVCKKYFSVGQHLCYCDEHCRDYIPDIKEEGAE